jgi:hypothetical protein
MYRMDIWFVIVVLRHSHCRNLTRGARNLRNLKNVRVQGDDAKGNKAMSLSKPASAFAAGVVLASLAACLGVSAAAAESNDHKPAVVTHRTHHAYRLYNRAGPELNSAITWENDHGWYENGSRNRGDRRLTWSQMPPCHNNYITGVPCITSYDFGCWKRNDDDPVEHCGYNRRPG